VSGAARGRSREAGTGLAPRLRALGNALGRALRAIVGAPDYERYLEHMRRAHPGRAPMGRAEFVRQRLAARYERPGSRCC
jgi:uncharacterized short protein YbdD (DUF466 family)